MSDFIGVVMLEKAIPCLKEVSGKRFKSRISGKDISIVFPSIPDDYEAGKIDFKKGDLVVPKNIFGEKVKWGMVQAWPKGLFSVNAFLCYANGELSDIKEIYEDFPRWKEKIYNLLQSKEAYSNIQLSELFTNAGSDKEIALSYELLITAYRAMERHDFRSAVVLGGTAVEQATLKQLRQEYSSNRQFKKEKSKTKYSTLRGRFRWLTEKGISVPVADYKHTIVDVRNDATHEGVRPSHNDTKICLENCKVLIETYHPNKLEI